MALLGIVVWYRSFGQTVDFILKLTKKGKKALKKQQESDNHYI